MHKEKAAAIHLLFLSYLSGHVSVARPFVVSGLFAHEHKISVLNFVLNRHQAFSGPVKSKVAFFFFFFSFGVGYY